jgi:TonB family protein
MIGLVRISIAPAILVGITIASGQQPTPTPTPKVLECSIPVYKPSEVDRRVKVLTYPEPNFDFREFLTNQGTVIVLRSIFCGSGKVTDIKVQRGVSKRLDEEAIRTAKTIKFRPAEKNGEKVSQWMTLEYHLND